MPVALDVSCPSCGKALKVPAAADGKRVKCKACMEVFLVKAPAPKPGAAPAAKAPPAGKAPVPAAEQSGAKPEPPAPTGPSAYKVTWEDNDDDSAAVGVVREEDIPRCPHCAKELDPPDAVVCVHCGFNSRTRTRAASRKVYAPTQAEWTAHLLPGVLGAVGVLLLVALDAVAVLNMRGWMEGGVLEMDDLGADGKTKKMFVSPGFFIALVWFGSLAVGVPLAKFAYKRLVKEYHPPETAMT